MGACFAITLLPILLNRVYSSLDRSGSVLYQAVTVRAEGCRVQRRGEGAVQIEAAARLRPEAGGSPSQRWEPKGEGVADVWRAACAPRPVPRACQVAVVLEPNTGDSFRKLLMRVLGAGCAGGIGMLLLFCGAGDGGGGGCGAPAFRFSSFLPIPNPNPN